MSDFAGHVLLTPAEFEARVRLQGTAVARSVISEYRRELGNQPWFAADARSAAANNVRNALARSVTAMVAGRMQVPFALLEAYGFAERLYSRELRRDAVLLRGHAERLLDAAVVR